MRAPISSASPWLGNRADASFTFADDSRFSVVVWLPANSQVNFRLYVKSKLIIKYPSSRRVRCRGMRIDLLRCERRSQ